MSAEKLRCALVGAGRHSDALVNIIQQPGSRSEIVAVVDPDRRQGQAMAQKLNLDRKRYFPCLTAGVDGLMLDGLELEKEIDAYVVATPAHVRYPVGYGLAWDKHVFCENPLALTAKQVKVFDHLASWKNLVLMHNEQWFCLPGVNKLSMLTPWDLKRIVIRGKGREVETEVTRIGSHLLSVVTKLFTGPMVACTLWEDCRDVFEFSTGVGVQVVADFRPRPEGYKVDHCFIRMDGKRGSWLAQGGFLESVYQRAKPCLSADPLQEIVDGWEPVEVPNVWPIKDGMETQAQKDPKMNPTFGLWCAFEILALYGGRNPYPPNEFLPTAQAMDMIWSLLKVRDL